MKLIVGLGNPGKQYDKTRHNMGYASIDKFAELSSTDIDRSGFKGIYGICKNPAFPETVLLLKPETFMNLSGESVRLAMDYYKIDIEDILIVFDDMALEPGKIRARLNGSSGGQKGMQNIIDILGTDQIKRIRVGIGEPPHSGVDWVLNKPSGEDEKLLDEATGMAAKAIRDFLLHDFAYVMNHYNGQGG